MTLDLAEMERQRDGYVMLGELILRQVVLPAFDPADNSEGAALAKVLLKLARGSNRAVRIGV